MLGPGVYERQVDWDKVGAIVTKSVTLHPRKGNDGEWLKRPYTDTLLNRAGLPNSGIKEFMTRDLPELKKWRVPVCVSLYADNPSDMENLVGYMLFDQNWKSVAALELNISCPNNGLKPFDIEESVDLIKAALKPIRQVNEIAIVSVKVPPGATAAPIALVAEALGVHMITSCNTFKTCHNSKSWGLSGANLRPLAIETFNSIRQAGCTLPIIASGGITTKESADEYFKLGAMAVQVVSGEMLSPGFAAKLAQEYPCSTS